MRKIFIFFFCIIIGQWNLTGQSTPLIQKYTQFIDLWNTGDFYKGFEKIYEYNTNGKLLKLTTKSYNADGSLKSWFARFYDYNAQHQVDKIIQRRYNWDVDLWITTVWVDYLYDDLGCLIEEKNTRNVGGVYKKVEYERDDLCRNTKETIWRNYGADNELEIEFLFEQEYLQDGVSYIQKLYRRSWTDSLYQSATREYYINDFGDSDEYYQTVFQEDQDTFYQTKYIYEYDIHQNRTKYSKYFTDPDKDEWDLRSESFYYNEYDKNGFLIKLRTEQLLYHTNPPTVDVYDDATITYVKDCNDLEKVRTVFAPHFFTKYRYESIYLGENECFDIENVLLEMDVFPNPTYGGIEIASPILESGNTNISVFGMDGKLLLQKNEPSQCSTTDLDLSGLPDGIYVIQLGNENHFITEKLMVAK